MNSSPDVTPEILKAKADQDAKVMNALNINYKNFVKNEKASNALRQKMVQEYKNLASIENAPGMKNIYNELGEGFNIISTVQSQYVNKIETKVIPKMADQSNIVKSLKDTVAHYQKAKVNLEKQNIAQQKAIDPAKKQAAISAVQSAKLEVEQWHNKLNEQLQSYEKDRVATYKSILLHILNSEMYYHAQALSKLSELIKKVNDVDEKKEAEKSIDVLLKK